MAKKRLRIPPRTIRITDVGLELPGDPLSDPISAWYNEIEKSIASVQERCLAYIKLIDQAPVENEQYHKLSEYLRCALVANVFLSGPLTEIIKITGKENELPTGIGALVYSAAKLALDDITRAALVLDAAAVKLPVAWHEAKERSTQSEIEHNTETETQS